MRTFFTILVILLIAAVSLSAQAGDADEAATKNDAGRNYNLDSSKPAEDETVSAKPIILDAKNYNLTPAAFQKSALKALLKYNWKIEANEATRVQGSYIKSGKTYKAEIRYTGNTIVVGFVPGFHHTGNGWLRKLAKEMKEEVAAQSRDAEAQRYMKQ